MIAKQYARSLTECAMCCIETYSCFSTNFRENECELLDSNEDIEFTLQDAAEWSYTCKLCFIHFNMGAAA